MRTELILLIRAKFFGMWWPGTELNRRRQPFQGCALPPELPGHFFFRITKDRRFSSAGCALLFGGRPMAAHSLRAHGTCEL